MYFLPASTWMGNDISIDIDFNFKSDAHIETICNINIRQKGKLPRGLSSVTLKADSIDYSLYDIKILSVDSRTNTVRITSKLSHDTFLQVMQSKDLSLNIIIEGVPYACIPSEAFLILQREFQNNYFEIEHILQ